MFNYMQPVKPAAGGCDILTELWLYYSWVCADNAVG